jgi:hypothetical protein
MSFDLGLVMVEPSCGNCVLEHECPVTIDDREQSDLAISMRVDFCCKYHRSIDEPYGGLT